MFPPGFCLVKCLGLIRFVSSESQSWMQRPGMVAGSCFACEPFKSQLSMSAQVVPHETVRLSEAVNGH